MRVHILKGKGRGLYGFTPDPSGTNLPADKGPWQEFKSIEIFEEHRVPRVGVYEADVLAGIKRDGYYLMDEQAIESELFERRRERDEARRIAANVAKLPELLGKR